MQRTGGNIGPSQRPFVSDTGQSGQKVVPPRLEQCFLGQRTGRDETHHITVDDRFRSPLFRLGRAFHLFAHGHAKSLADERQQIAFGGMNRNTTHRDVIAIMFAAFGQGDVQRLGCGRSIIKEQFVKITHAIEQQCIRILGFYFQILRHHGSDG